MTALGMIHHRFERGKYVLLASRIVAPGATMQGINLFSLYRKGARRQIIPVAHCVRAARVRDIAAGLSGRSA